MRKLRFPRILLLSLTLVVLMTYDAAAVPQIMNYQGRLTDDQGQPITNTVLMTFTIYDAETDGNSKWSETHPSVSVVDGLFSVVLGQGDPAVPIEDSVFWGHYDSNRWLEIVVEGETIAPRTKITSAAYALQAGWTRDGTTLYTTYPNLNIARQGSVVHDNINESHVNLGMACTTGVAGAPYGGNRWCTVSGGYKNVARPRDADDDEAGATVSGGVYNSATARYCTVGGGIYNTATADLYNGMATVGGGQNNIANGRGATVAGGIRDSAIGYCATVPGGYHCTAQGRFTFASGRHAKSLHDGTYVWADTTDEDFASTGDNQFLIRADGGVGIGTSTPLSPLHVQSANNWNWTLGNGWGDFNVGDTTHGLSIGVATEGGGAGSVRMWTAGGNGNLTFGNASNGDFMTIKGTGEVGVGTTNPEGNLHVSAGAPSVIVDATDEADAKLLFRDADDPSNQSFEIAFNAADQDLHIRSDDNSGTDIVTVTHGGLIGIKETSPSVSLHVNGSICYTAGFGACSDERYKKDITPITSAIDKLDRLRGVSFKWKKDKYPKKEFDDKPQLGIIAQEVKEVFPELVMQDNDGYYSVDYVKLTPVLIEAVKELKAENDELKAQMTHLTSLVESILAQQRNCDSNTEKLVNR